MKRKALEILFLVYLVIGVFIAITDAFVLPVYLIILPFHFFLLYESIKTRNVFFILFCLVLFISYGIGSIPFYLDRANANWQGFTAIGNFDFSYKSLFQAYSQMAVFLLSLWAFVLLFKKEYHTNFIVRFVDEQSKAFAIQPSIRTSVPILFLIACFLSISIWMYNMHIGMIGLPTATLPYHLAGILFYSRRFLFPLVLLFVFVKTQSKAVPTIALIVYAFAVGVLATSKSAALIIMAPLAIINFVDRNYFLCFLCVLSFVGIYLLVGQLRELVYLTDAQIDWRSVFIQKDVYTLSDRNVFYDFAKLFTQRIYGLQSTVLGYQYRQLSLKDIYDFYVHSRLNAPDYVEALFSISLPEDKAFGVNLGFPGAMHLLSGRNYLFSVLQAFLVAVIFCFTNECIQRIFSLQGLTLLKFFALILLLFSFLKFYDGYQMKIVYVSILLLFLVYRLAYYLWEGRENEMKTN